MKPVLAVRWMLPLLLSLLAAAPALAGRDFLVDGDWLAARLKDPKLVDPKIVVLEVRYHPHRYFTIGHIPGAVQVQRFKDLGGNTATPLTRFPTRAAFQATLRGFGVNDDSLLVLYDDSRTALASRLYYLLALYGYDMTRVKVLDGGTVEWTAFNELTREAARPRPGRVTLRPADPALMVEWTQVYDDVVARRDPRVALVDARPRDMYTGKVIRHSVLGGHIPGAVNIVSLDATDGATQKWLGDERLTALYRDIPKDRRVYVYCHDGFRSTLAWLQLRHLGYRDVRVYNGGWSHWGNVLTLPVVEGEQPLDEEFAL